MRAKLFHAEGKTDMRKLIIALSSFRAQADLTSGEYLSQYLTNLMHKICFTVSFISCLYMFRAHVLIIRRSKLYYTASGIITPICGRLVHRLIIHIKTLKTLLHVSIIRSSSGSILCFSLKLQFKTLSVLLSYINLLAPELFF